MTPLNEQMGLLLWYHYFSVNDGGPEKGHFIASFQFVVLHTAISIVLFQFDCDSKWFYLFIACFQIFVSFKTFVSLFTYHIELFLKKFAIV